MKLGSHNLLFFFLIFFWNISIIQGQEKIDLENLQPTFEEEPDSTDSEDQNEILKIKSKIIKKIEKREIIEKLRALDKITAKTSNIDIVLGKKKKFGYLEILPKNCKKTQENQNTGVAAYLQVKDLSEKRDEKVFVFNGWTFSSSPTLRPFDHPVYDIWLTGCENI